MSKFKIGDLVEITENRLMKSHLKIGYICKLIDKTGYDNFWKIETESGITDICAEHTFKKFQGLWIPGTSQANHNRIMGTFVNPGQTCPVSTTYSYTGPRSTIKNPDIDPYRVIDEKKVEDFEELADNFNKGLPWLRG